MSIQFGTDGWRAVISDEFTFANVRRVAQAIADWVQIEAERRSWDGRPLVVVGFDTRFLSDRYAAAVAEVLAGNAIGVLLCRHFAPTPAVSYAIVAHQAIGGVMITASHNAPRYNGIKLKAAYGGSAGSADARRVEALLAAQEREGRKPRVLALTTAEQQGLVERFDPYPAYADHVRRLVDLQAIARARLRLVVDAMYGAGMGYTDRLLAEVGIEPLRLHHELNPGFGGLHPEPIARHLHALCSCMGNGKFDLGLATDGDADRIGAVGPNGRFVDPHRIMALVLDDMLRRGQRGDVVKTVSTTQMLNLLAEPYGLTVHETPVGFNHISELMLKGDVLIGGEESGGISVRHHIPEGDGVLMGLLLAEIVARNGGDIQALIGAIMARVGRFVYARHDYRVQPFAKTELIQRLIATAPTRLADHEVVGLNARDGVKYVLDDQSWLLIRPSGTEPVLRVYAEARDEEELQQLLSEGTRLTGYSDADLT